MGCCEKNETLTFIAISHTIKVDIVIVIFKEHETKERSEAVDGNDEQYTDDPSLLIGT